MVALVSGHLTAAATVPTRAAVISFTLVKDFVKTLKGELPEKDKDFLEASSVMDEVKALIDVCQSMHCIMPFTEGTSTPICDLNPAQLCCTCKGFRMQALCAHVIAVTADYVTDDMCRDGAASYDATHLEKLVAKLAEKGKRASHRPRNVVGGAHIQPHGDAAHVHPYERIHTHVASFMFIYRHATSYLDCVQETLRMTMTRRSRTWMRTLMSCEGACANILTH